MTISTRRPERCLTRDAGAAARGLGVRSINTIKRWAREGRLDGVRRGGRLLVSAASVQRHPDRSVAEWEPDADPDDPATAPGRGGTSHERLADILRTT